MPEELQKELEHLYNYALSFSHIENIDQDNPLLFDFAYDVYQRTKFMLEEIGEIKEQEETKTKRQVSVIELFGFDDDGEHVQEFFNETLANYKWGKGQYVIISNLNEKGIRNVDEHVFSKKEETSWN